jgi:2-polyprenyl-3-methyl-5-hydroxy-6-metoxy-1,4-benzoquinol methylase
MKKKENKCKICRNKENNKLYNVKEMMFGLRESFTYMQCGDCDCLQLETIPNDLEKYYPPEYYSLSVTKKSFLGEVKRKLRVIRNTYAFEGKGIFGKILDLHCKTPSDIMAFANFNPSKDANILDVGSGNGDFLRNLSDLGFVNLLGVDPFVKNKISNIKIIRGALGDIKGKWDYIFFNHSFEHMEGPERIFRKVRELLSNDGKCIIRIPIFPSYAWKKYGTNWVQLDAPRHFYIHSIKSIKILANHVGLEVENMVYDSTEFQFWGSELYKMGIPLKNVQLRKYFTNANIREFKKEAKRLNKERKGDQAIFYLRSVSKNTSKTI